MLLALLSLFLVPSTTAEYFAPNSPLRELARGAFLNSWPVTNVPVEYCTNHFVYFRDYKKTLQSQGLVHKTTFVLLIV